MKLTIEGYKSIGDARSIDLPGLTVLAGTNSSGKSSFMQPFLLIKQTLENDYDTGTLVLDGPNVKVTDLSQIKSKILGIDNKTLRVALENEKEKTTISYSHRKRVGLAVESIHCQNKEFPDGVTFTTKLKPLEIKKIFSTLKDHNNFIKTFQKFQFDYRIQRKKCFLTITSTIKKQPIPFRIGIDLTETIENLAQRTIHVPGLRGNPERSYKTAVSETKFPGSFEKYVASIIHGWRTKRSTKEKFLRLIDQLNSLGLASSLETGFINDTRLEIRVSRFRGNTVDNSDYVNIADVGFGVSQTLPVLVALIAASKGQLVYIEQPELHLHPKAQFNLAKPIAEAINRGVLVVIETHSSILLRGIQILVAEKFVPAKKVALNWFTQNPCTGQSEVSKAELDSHGAFGDWPEDFDDTSLEADQKYLDAVEKAIYEAK